MLTLFYSSQLSTTDRHRVEGDEALHGIKSLRLELGEEVKVTNGVGEWLIGSVSDIGKKYFEINVSRRGKDEEKLPRLIVIQALTKSDRMKETIELLTVGGADEIIPWESERSIAKWQSDSRAKWDQIVVSASKQSRRTRFPQIGKPLKSAEIRESYPDVLVLHESASNPISSTEISGDSLVIVVGPEGGISENEISLIGGKQVRLGAEVLRSAQAGFAGLAAIQTLLKRW